MVKLLFCRKHRKYYAWGGSGDFHCEFGTLRKKDLDAAGDGGPVTSTTGAVFRIITRRFADQYGKLQRLAQIISPKDAGHIISVVGNDYTRVLDCGTGSGALSIFLAQMNKEAQIFSVDIREDHLAHAKKNVDAFGLSNISFIHHDIYTGIPEKGIDLLTLDIPEPYRIVPFLKESLVPGAFMVVYVPSANQVLDFVNALDDRFFVIKTVEIMERFWNVGGKVLRPSTHGAQHTGFLVFARYIGS